MLPLPQWYDLNQASSFESNDRKCCEHKNDYRDQGSYRGFGGSPGSGTPVVSYALRSKYVIGTTTNQRNMSITKALVAAQALVLR